MTEPVDETLLFPDSMPDWRRRELDEMPTVEHQRAAIASWNKRPPYPEDMPFPQRDRLDRVDDPDMVRMLLGLWENTQGYEERVANGDDAFERSLERAAAQREKLRLKGRFEAAVAGRLGETAKHIAAHIVKEADEGTTQERFHEEFDKAWRAEVQGQRNKRQREREQRRARAAQPDMYPEAS